MKKIGLALLAVVLTAMSGTSCGQFENQLYGRANVSVNYTDLGASNPLAKDWQLNSNASRLGFRGSYQISETLEAIYQLEIEINFNDHISSTARGKDRIENRNTYIGLQGSFGRIIAGKYDSIAKTVGREVDRFNDQVLGDIKSFMEGEDRVSDLVLYTTPSWKGFSVSAGIITDDDSSAVDDGGGLAEGSTISLDYSNDFVRASIVNNDDIDKQDLTRVMSNFYIGATEIGFIWQQAERIDIAADEESWFISAEHRINDNWRIKGQFGITEYSLLDNKDKQLAVGIDRIISNDVFVFFNYVQNDRDETESSHTDFSTAIGIQVSF